MCLASVAVCVWPRWPCVSGLGGYLCVSLWPWWLCVSGLGGRVCLHGLGGRVCQASVAVCVRSRWPCVSGLGGLVFAHIIICKGLGLVHTKPRWLYYVSGPVAALANLGL